MKKFLICLSLALVSLFSIFAVTFSYPATRADAADDTVRYELSYQYKEGPTSVESAITLSGGLTIATKFAGNTVHDVGEEITIDFTPQPYYSKNSDIISEYTFLRFDYQLHENGDVLSLRPGDKISFTEDDLKDLIAYDNGVKMLTLVAVYSERILGKVHKVTFLASPKFETVYVQDGQKLNSIEQVMEGYDFDGWYTDKALTSKYDFDNYTVTSDLMLYPKFTKQTQQEKTEIEEQVDGLFNSVGVTGLEFSIQIIILVGLVIVVISIFK